ncbi:MAG: hypothetical protein D3916_12940 [Candidatus Electrothrix sp. MAN1_4]|nr:hypothetical protein [Candidatus Electrothrix sp. MAN1_4]
MVGLLSENASPSFACKRKMAVEQVARPPLRTADPEVSHSTAKESALKIGHNTDYDNEKADVLLVVGLAFPAYGFCRRQGIKITGGTGCGQSKI